jgi:septum formation protein
MTTVVLASASPARRATLTAAGIDPVVRASAVDEEAVVARHGARAAQDVALLLARAKAEDVAALLGDGVPDGLGALVIGCDSVLELDGEIHGKPGTAERATERWRRMRGRTGVLHTGHWVVDVRDAEAGGSGAGLGAVASTRVHFADLADDEIAAYVATGEPLAVAGAFTVDGLGGAYVLGVEGDHHAVVGISLPLLRQLLAQVGVRWHTLWRRSR